MSSHLDDRMMSNRSLMTSDYMPEETLQALFRQGDPQAFSIVCDRNYQRLLRTAYKILKNMDDAQDAVQDALFSALKGARSFNAASRISTWLTRIVINACLIQLRKRHRRSTVSLDLQPDDSMALVDLLEDNRYHTLREVLAQEQREILASAIGSLKPTLRDTLRMYQGTEVSVSQLAEQESLSTSALKSRLFRAKNALRKEYLRRHGKHMSQRGTIESAFM